MVKTWEYQASDPLDSVKDRDKMSKRRAGHQRRAAGTKMVLAKTAEGAQPAQGKTRLLSRHQWPRGQQLRLKPGAQAWTQEWNEAKVPVCSRTRKRGSAWYVCECVTGGGHTSTHTLTHSRDRRQSAAPNKLKLGHCVASV